MAAVGLDDHRVAGAQSAGGVAPRHREGEGKITRSEHGHGAERQLHAAQVRARQRLPVGKGAVDAGIDPRSVTGRRREQAQLPHGTATLSRQPRDGEGCLRRGTLDERIAEGEDLVRNALEEGAARCAGRPGERSGGALRGGDCLVAIHRPGEVKFSLQLTAAGGGRDDECPAAPPQDRGDEIEAVERGRHRGFLRWTGGLVRR